jgi:hypothetical protein
MTAAKPCPEYLRLQEHYEAALRRWGYVLQSQHAGLVGRDNHAGADTAASPDVPVRTFVDANPSVGLLPVVRIADVPAERKFSMKKSA